MLPDLIDEKCWDLAEHFLGAGITESEKRCLASHIQEAVEDWFGLRQTQLDEHQRRTSNVDGDHE